jgi:hypothetical protein
MGAGALGSDGVAGLVQEAKASPRSRKGGARRGAGRPPLISDPVRRTITFERADLALLLQMGAGNASRGARLMLARFRAGQERGAGIAQET